MNLYACAAKSVDWEKMKRFFEARAYYEDIPSRSTTREALICRSDPRVSLKVAADSWWAWAHPAPVVLHVSQVAPKTEIRFRVSVSGLSSRALLMVPGLMVLAAVMYEILFQPARAFRPTSIVIASVLLGVFLLIPGITVGASLWRVRRDSRAMRSLIEEFIS